MKVWRLLLSSLVLLGFRNCLAFADPPQGDAPAPDDNDNPPITGLLSEERALITVERIQEVDAKEVQLRGLRLSTGSWDETECDFNGYGLLSVEIAQGGSQRILRGGLTTGLMLFAIGPIRFSPRLGLQIQYRGEEPHAGIGGEFVLGVELAAWVAKKWQVAVVADRDFGFPSGTRKQFAVALRWAPRRLPWWPTPPQPPPQKAVE